MSHAFRYMIEFEDFANPPGKKAVFEQSLRDFAGGVGLDCTIGALGGTARTYGCVSQLEADVTADDRQLFITWLESQPIKCTARIGPLEAEATAKELLGEINHLVFLIDNLTESDRIVAATHAERIKALIQKSSKPTVG